MCYINLDVYWPAVLNRVDDKIRAYLGRFYGLVSMVPNSWHHLYGVNSDWSHYISAFDKTFS
jgi:hypothetical protein